MSFAAESFWVSLYMQNVLGYSPLGVAIHLLPQAFGGIAVNIAAAFILDKISNKLLMGLSAVCYVACALSLATMTAESSYWPHIFPYLLLSVIGADLQFNVANVRLQDIWS